MLGCDRAVAEQLDLLAVDDGVDVGGAELAEALSDLVGLRQRVVLSLALLVLGEGLVELAGDDRLVHLRRVDEDLFLLSQLGR